MGAKQAHNVGRDSQKLCLPALVAQTGDDGRLRFPIRGESPSAARPAKTARLGGDDPEKRTHQKQGNGIQAESVEVEQKRVTINERIRQGLSDTPPVERFGIGCVAVGFQTFEEYMLLLFSEECGVVRVSGHDEEGYDRHNKGHETFDYEDPVPLGSAP